MLRIGYLVGGFASLALGGLGMLLPLLPTVPFVILAAFFFARSSPVLERKLVNHRSFGPHIEAWRTRRAISRRGKAAAAFAFVLSATLGFLLLNFPWSLIPAGAALISGSWLLTRPTA